MKVSEGQGDLRGIKLSFRFREAPLFREVLEKFASLYELHDEVDAVRLLEDVVHSDNERVVHLF